nr:hypothetical protein CFP56_14860 [Quercus suber]
MDLWDAMIARDASGSRDEPVEILEQCEMVTTLQTNGTDMGKATEDLSKSLFEAMWTKEEESKMVVENAWHTRVEGS